MANRGQCEMDERHHPQSERAPVVARGGMRRMRANAHRARSFARRKKKGSQVKDCFSPGIAMLMKSGPIPAERCSSLNEC